MTGPKEDAAAAAAAATRGGEAQNAKTAKAAKSAKAVKVPRVVRDIQDATRRDIAPAVRLMGRIFLGTLIGGQESFVRDVATAGTAAPKRGHSSSSREGASASAAAAASASPAPPGAIIIDAEIVEEECGTCGGSRKVGRPGYEVPCPKCEGRG